MCSKTPSDSENDKTDLSENLTTNLNIKQETKIKLNFSVDRLLSIDCKDSKLKSTAEPINNFQSGSHQFMYMNNGLVCCKLSNSPIVQKSEQLRHLASCSSIPVNFGNIFIPTPRYAQSGKDYYFVLTVSYFLPQIQ